MDFNLTEQQLALRQTVQTLLKKEFPREFCRQADEAETFPLDKWAKLVEVGLLGLVAPSKYGGADGSVLDEVMVVEELSRGFTALGLAYSIWGGLTPRIIMICGTEQHREDLIPKMANGEVRACFAVTEPSGGSDLLSLSLFAKPDGNDFVLNGQKIFITLADLSHFSIVLARTDKNPSRKSLGLTLFLVDNKSPGLEITRLKKLGGKSASVTEVFFNDVRVPKQNILGKMGNGWYDLIPVATHERVVVGAISLGIARAAFDDALAYAKERIAFGRPIGQYQAIQHYLADSAMEIEMASLALQKAAWLVHTNQPSEIEAHISKVSCTETAFRVATRGMNILGGYGFIREYDMQRYFRDCRQYTLGPISNEMARNHIAQNLGLPKSY